ncbi:MAG: GNAT family N-acetyltransferase [Lentisphaeria bacterium]|nr:GNAT family N-acetyltransferase [Lentisphaeria bacterium]
MTEQNTNKPEITRLTAAEAEKFAAAYAGSQFSHVTAGYLKNCLRRQETGARRIFAAYQDSRPAGLVHLLIEGTEYPGFQEYEVPEISDLSVLAPFRQHGIGSALLRRCEEEARKEGFGVIGLRVGLYADYGPAQILYWKSGYRPDGTGVWYGARQVEPGAETVVDDDLLLALVKLL